MTGLVSLVVMMMSIAQQPGTNEIYEQSEHGDANGVIEADRARMNQPRDRLVRHEQRDNDQEHRAGVAAEHLDLPCSEREPRVVGEPPSADVSEHREAERERVR